jgi:hypothetical protein
MENSMEATQKIKIELPYDSAIPLLGYTQRNISQVTIKAPAALETTKMTHY